MNNCSAWIGVVGGLAMWAGAAGAAEVLLWNRLGSDAEVVASEIGPGGTKTGGYFVPGPFPSFGHAFENAAPGQQLLQFPGAAALSNAKGTVEFWAKLTGALSSPPGSGGLHLISALPANPPALGLRIGFVGNDGCGGSGLFGTFGVATDAVCHGVVDTAVSGTLDQILGDRSAWHHYAIVWNKDGIAALGGRKVYLFLDGSQVNTPYLQDRSPWGIIPSDSRFALAAFFGASNMSIAVDNLISWDDVRTDFSDRFNENPVGQEFATFNARTELTLGRKPNDDSYRLSGFLSLAPGSDGIDPLTEAVTLKVGSFAATLPAGAFVLDGDTYKYNGSVGRSYLIVRVSPLTEPSAYSFRSILVHGDLAATTMKPQVQLAIGDDRGGVTLDLAKARFGKGRFGEEWVFGDGASGED